MEKSMEVMKCLPDDVICGSIFPLLSVRDLQSLDTAYTNKDLRPHLRRLWTLYNYDNIDVIINYDDMVWMLRAGVRLVAMKIEKIDKVASLNANISTLKQLVIEDLVKDSVFLHIAENCPLLEVLRVRSGIFSNDGLITLVQNSRQLNSISWRNIRVTDTYFHTLCDNCPYLLHIHCSNQSNAALTSIASTYPHLQSITINGRDVTDAGLLAIAEKCHELTSLTASYSTRYTIRGLAALWAANPNLKDIDICYNRFISDDDIMILLQCCPQLQKLNIASCHKITDAAVIAVAEHCPQLTSLNICGCDNISDDALIALGQHCHGLTSFFVADIKNVSYVGITALTAGCPLLKELRAWFIQVSDAGLTTLALSCRNLRKIDYGMCQSIDFDAISALAHICPLISELNLCYGESVDDSCLYVIAGHFRNLTKVCVAFESGYPVGEMLRVKILDVKLNRFKSIMLMREQFFMHNT